MDAVCATLIGVGITACVSICAILSNLYITKRTLRYSTAREVSMFSLEYKIRQLNELYGPLLLLLEQNKILAKKLREGKGDPQKWRLLDNIPNVLANPKDKALVELIMENDAKVENLIISKGGLIRSPGPPESFNLFLGHYKILKLALEKKERPQIKEFEYYPRQFDQDVLKAHKAINQEIYDLQSKYEDVLTK